jgi:hypothetical protein
MERPHLRRRPSCARRSPGRRTPCHQSQSIPAAARLLGRAWIFPLRPNLTPCNMGDCTGPLPRAMEVYFTTFNQVKRRGELIRNAIFTMTMPFVIIPARLHRRLVTRGSANSGLHARIPLTLNPPVVVRLPCSSTLCDETKDTCFHHFIEPLLGVDIRPQSISEPPGISSVLKGFLRPRNHLDWAKRCPRSSSIPVLFPPAHGTPTLPSTH